MYIFITKVFENMLANLQVYQDEINRYWLNKLLNFSLDIV